MVAPTSIAAEVPASLDAETPRTDPSVRSHSVRQVVERLLRHGPTSRAEVSRATGLSKQTISEAIRVLEREGWVNQEGALRGGVGRTAITYAIRPQAAFVLGIDLGGTKVHVALADLGGEIVEEALEPTDPAGAIGAIAQIARMARTLAAKAGIEPHRIRGAAMGSPGVVDPASGRIGIAPNIPGLDQMDVRRALRDALGVEVAIENDVNLAAVGEHWRGSSRGRRNFVFVAVGTGIGMGIFADGRLVRGARGAAGEIAYLPIGGDPYDARGHVLGTLESAVGSAAITGRYVGLGGETGLSVRDMFDRLDSDPRAAAALDECARTIAAALLAVHAVLDPEVALLGGSIGSRSELRDRIASHLGRCMTQPLPVEISALGNRATLTGAIGSAIDGVHRSLFGLGAEAGPLALPALHAEAAE